MGIPYQFKELIPVNSSLITYKENEVRYTRNRCSS